MTRKSQAFVDEVLFRRCLRSLGIANQSEWLLWCRGNAERRRSLGLPHNPAATYQNPRFWREFRAAFPRHWGRLCSLRRGSGGVEKSTTEAKFFQFAERYRVADGFRGMRFSGLGRSSSIYYSAAVQVFLAYSALEACRHAIGRPAAKMAIIDPLLAEELRKAAKGIRPQMAEVIACARLRRRFAHFMSGVSDDVFGFASAIAHVVGQGALAPWGLEALTIRSANVYDKLARALLARSDQLLGEYCARFVAMRQCRN